MKSTNHPTAAINAFIYGLQRKRKYLRYGKKRLCSDGSSDGYGYYYGWNDTHANTKFKKRGNGTSFVVELSNNSVHVEAASVNLTTEYKKYVAHVLKSGFTDGLVVKV